MNETTTDSFFDGKLTVKQNSAGYRFSIDAILLAFHARPRAQERVLDLGCGCGIISLVLAYRHPDITAYGVEIQYDLARMAVSNVNANHLQNQITVLCRDMRGLKPDLIGGPVDLIVCNPPYHKPNSGRLNPNQQRAMARHELSVNLNDILQAAKRMLRTAGRLVTIYTAERMIELLVLMRSHGIEPKFVRAVHSQLTTEAKLVLVGGTKGGRPGTRLDRPLIVYDSNGAYSQEVQGMFMA